MIKWKKREEEEWKKRVCGMYEDMALGGADCVIFVNTQNCRLLLSRFCH